MDEDEQPWRLLSMSLNAPSACTRACTHPHEARAAGIVQHAVLLGLPASSDPARWRRLRRVVAGRLVNCYRPDDLVLSLAHRAAQLKAFGVAGLSPVPAGAGVESYNVSRLVRAHHRYRFTVGPVLRHVGLTED